MSPQTQPKGKIQSRKTESIAKSSMLRQAVVQGNPFAQENFKPMVAHLQNLSELEQNRLPIAGLALSDMSS